jgi:hypothetical protein
MYIETQMKLIEHVNMHRYEEGYISLSQRLMSSVNGAMKEYSASVSRRDSPMFDMAASAEATLTNHKKVKGVLVNSVRLEDLTDAFNSKFNSQVVDSIAALVRRATGLAMLRQDVEDHKASYVFGKSYGKKEERQNIDELYVECSIKPAGRSDYHAVFTVSTTGEPIELSKDDFRHLIDGLTLAMLYLRQTGKKQDFEKLRALGEYQAAVQDEKTAEEIAEKRRAAFN